MMNSGILLLIVILFYFLGRAADLIIVHLRKLGEALDIKIFFLGILLGFFTSLPEMALGVNAVINNISEVSLGNLLGGIVVLFGLILGAGSVLNRKISTDGKIKNFLPILIFIFLPLLLGLNGYLGFIDGVILIINYGLLALYLYFTNKGAGRVTVDIGTEKKTMRNIFLILLGLVIIIVTSNLIIKFSVLLLESFRISSFFIGLIVFSLGTNLPEIMVTLRSWRRHVKELSMSNLIGSAMANIFIIGILVVLKPLNIEVGLSYYLIMLFFALLFIFLLIFYKTDRSLTRKEGAVLIIIYFLFLFSQSLIFLQ